ncbi:MAG: hypothetical protein NTX59_05150 [Elusimicrobia bacterium]|nr:hypothetical protein [Elusimicrobiota bacterium]
MNLKQNVKELAIKAGVNRAIVFAVFTYSWSILAGPLSVFLIITFLTPSEQGYYYTFYGVLALANMLELGAGSVFQLMAGHIWAKLGLDDKNGIIGDDDEKCKLAEILRIAYKWFFWAGTAAFSSVAIGGIFFFNSKALTPAGVNSAWLAFCLAGFLNFFVTPALYILDGCGQLHATSKYRLMQAAVSSMVTWTAILCGVGLWAPAAASAASFALIVSILLAKYGKFFAALLRMKTRGLIDWKTRIWPLQWRLAVSVSSGYFTMSFVTPVLFYFCGPVVAGQMGVAGTITTALINIPLNWVRCRIPEFSWLIAKRQFAELNGLFRRAFRQMALVALTLLLPVVILLAGLHYIHHPWVLRLPATLPLGLFMLAALFQLPVAAMACYLRAYRHEPYMHLNLGIGLAYAALVPLTAKYSGFSAVAASSALISLAAALPAANIFFKKRAKWQKE